MPGPGPLSSVTMAIAAKTKRQRRALEGAGVQAEQRAEAGKDDRRDVPEDERERVGETNELA